MENSTRAGVGRGTVQAGADSSGLVFREGIIFLEGDALKLTKRELALMQEFLGNPDRVLSRPELFDAVWGGSLRRGDRLVDVYVGRLRAKLIAAGLGADVIHTHTGLGYRFSPPG